MSYAFRQRTLMLAAAWLVIFGQTALSDSWTSPQVTEHKSEAGGYVLRVTPSPDSSSPGHCRAEMLRVHGIKPTQVWSRDLINNIAPVRSYVTNSGRYVVTMDEWGHVGKFPVVVYAHDGGLVAVHSTDSLGLEGEDILHITQSVSSYWWNENALVFFEPREEVLCIRLHWGKLLLINLADGEVMSQKWYENRRGWDRDAEKWPELREYAEKRTGELVMRLLASNEPKERETGAIVAGQLQFRGAVQKLRDLLSDDAFYWNGCAPLFFVGLGKTYYVREAARNALDQMGIRVPASHPATRPSM